MTDHSALIERLDFNINDRVLVKVTEAGRLVEALHWSDYGLKAPPRVLDAEGYEEWQMWDLMQVFGPHISMGSPVPFETTIRIPLPSAPNQAKEAGE